MTATGEVPLTVSFKAPENLVLTITNDEVKSKKVNVTLAADFATMYEYYPGVDGVDPVTANIGESLSYQFYSRQFQLQHNLIVRPLRLFQYFRTNTMI